MDTNPSSPMFWKQIKPKLVPLKRIDERAFRTPRQQALQVRLAHSEVTIRVGDDAA
ncbi:hypothetical protein GGD65_007855 [Bradyrhizobium sp. CIR18]|uniref:hypothetical protein n=1 Tax=Bradyrhizobium sp. CIR18 TaxID=2663839 RepID=UPI001605FA42|nr:hypothetical protein [Bradyrhizobium sp. CIR18]MBB4366781.1 hypothetical protein [Bradyrhizobium sp. CIR18]